MGEIDRVLEDIAFIEFTVKLDSFETDVNRSCVFDNPIFRSITQSAILLLEIKLSLFTESSVASRKSESKMSLESFEVGNIFLSEPLSCTVLLFGTLDVSWSKREENFSSNFWLTREQIGL